MHHNEGCILILCTPESLELPEQMNQEETSLKLSVLLDLHKNISRFALDWELGTINNMKPSLVQDIHSQEATDFYRTYLEKFSTPVDLSQLRPSSFACVILPNLASFLGKLNNKVYPSYLVDFITEHIKEDKPIMSIGYGIAASFECLDSRGRWVFYGHNIASVSLAVQANEDWFNSSNSYLVEDKIRELFGEFCITDPGERLFIFDRNLISCTSEKALGLACAALGHYLTDS